MFYLMDNFSQRDKRFPRFITYLRGFKPIIKNLACDNNDYSGSPTELSVGDFFICIARQ